MVVMVGGGGAKPNLGYVRLSSCWVGVLTIKNLSAYTPKLDAQEFS